MTTAFDAYIESGFGSLDARAQIEGLAYEFVTSTSMEKTTSDGRRRVAGLKLETIKIGEKVDLARATVDLSGFTLRIVDDYETGVISTALAMQPAVERYLSAACTASDTTISLTSTSGLVGGGVMHIDTETILIGTVVGATCTGCTRGYWNTLAQAHYVPDGAHLRLPLVTDIPATLRGRRIRIYIYAQGDDMSGDGNQRWIGICSSDPSTSGGMGSYDIRIDPISKIFNQTLGSDLVEPVRPRGIYYPWTQPLRLTLALNTGANSASDIDASTQVDIVTTGADQGIYGFWETQEAFCNYLRGLVVTATTGAGWGIVADVRSLGPTGWALVFTTTTALYPRAFMASILDAAVGSVVGGFGYSSLNIYDDGGHPVFAVAAGATYYIPITASVPRGVYGWARRPATFADRAMRELWREDRVYFGGDFAVTSRLDACRVTWPGRDGNVNMDVSEVPVDTRDATNRSVSLRNTVFLARDSGGIAGSEFGCAYDEGRGYPQFRPARNYGSGTLYSLLAAMVADAPEFMNQGSCPDIRYSSDPQKDDIDLAAIATVIAEAADSTLTSTRDFAQLKSAQLDKVLPPEAQLLGLYWRLNLYGLLVLDHIRSPSDGDVLDESFPTPLVTGSNFGGFDRQGEGMINTVKLKLHYDDDRGEHDEVPVEVRDVQAFGISKQSAPLEIAPVFRSSIDSDIAQLTVQFSVVASRIFGIFGGPYAVLNVAAPAKAANVLAGHIVLLSHAQMPDPDTGLRGIVQRRALVVGRDWDLKTGRLVFSLMISLSRFAGYAPAMHISGQSGAGTSWTLTVDGTPPIGSGSYLPAGTDATDFFADGMKIRIWEWDADSPTERQGNVAGTPTATTIAVTTTSSWTPGTSTWVIGYDLASTSGLTSDQRRYGYEAGTDLLIDFTTAEAARVFTP